MKSDSIFKKLLTVLFAGIFLLLFSPAVFSQNFSSRDFYRGFRPFTDTLPKPHVKDTLHSPKKAAIYSAVLPGLGQAYNKKYWKIPIIYVGFGGLAYGFAWNEKYYKKYHTALKIRYDGDTATHDAYENRYSDNDLVTLKNYYRRYRDLCVIGMAALYTLNVLDAVVDAHLYYFDVSDKLSMRISPPMIYPGTHGINGVIGMQLCWR